MINTWLTEKPRGTIVLIHGVGEHHGRYQEWINRLNTRGFHVVAGDLPGHGKTRGKRGHIDRFDQYIDAVYNWYKEAAALDVPVFLFGHSLGGLIAVRTLMEKYLPVQGVILSSPCLGLADSPKRGVELAAKMMHHVTPSFRAKSGITAELLTRHEETRAAFRQDDLIVPTVTLRWYRELTKAVKQAQLYPDYYPDVSTLVMQAGEDYIVDRFSVRRWFNQLHISDCAYREWKGLYHELLHEPEREDVFSFLMHFVEQRLEKTMQEEGG
ncbi:alpha/beta hydrolase [Salibacterium lacus]|uniref:Alpha/beta hydrolase n=1 Tax=Salibacterium lacus TaxID=1898109 RepID=A0ABW5T1J3_9BACI